MIVRDQKELDWVTQNTLSKQELRQLIIEKAERARSLQQVEQNRKLAEPA